MLSSMLFRCDAKLQAAARNHTFHITRGAHGSHVSRIQLALLLLGFKVVDDREWRFGLYGESTAAAVLAYKRSRQIVNRAYQQQADDIVGIMTILQLDKELNALASCLPAGSYRPTTSGIRDSALHFELRRCIALLRQQARQNEPWSDTIMAGRGVGPNGHVKKDTQIMEAVNKVLWNGLAQEFNELLQVSVPGNMVGPHEGTTRDRICKKAMEQAKKHENKSFDQAGIDECWSVVEEEPKKKAPKPINLHWCGIYAAHIWKQAGFLDVTWSASLTPKEVKEKRPGVNKEKKPLLSSSRLSMLAPGDILIDQQPVFKEVPDPEDPNKIKRIPSYPNHHMLILAISVDRTAADILQGNSGKRPLPNSVVTQARLSLIGLNRTTHAFISVDTLRESTVTYR